VTTYSTGEVRTGGLTGMGAEFFFPGKAVARPETVTVGFGVLRTQPEDQTLPDDQLLHWKDVTSVTIEFSGQTVTFPAVEGYRVSPNKTVQLMFGRALEEHVDVKMPTPQYLLFAAAPEFKVEFGTEKRTVKGKSLDPMRRLAACIPG
jgi:hypothetical protein